METRTWSQSELQDRYGLCKTLGEALSRIEDEYYSHGSVICEIRVNGLRMEEADEKKYSQLAFSEINEMQIKTSPLESLFFDTVKSAMEFGKNLESAAIQSAELFRQDDEFEAAEAFKRLIDGSNWIVDVLIQVRKVASSQRISLDSEAWARAELKFLEVLQQILSAFERRDDVLLADLLEYEWTSSLNLWLNLLLEVQPSSGIRQESENTLDGTAGS